MTRQPRGPGSSDRDFSEVSSELRVRVTGTPSPARPPGFRLRTRPSSESDHHFLSHTQATQPGLPECVTPDEHTIRVKMGY